MAGFELTTNGRFWVTAEGVQTHSFCGSVRKPQGHPCVTILPCEAESSEAKVT
jgi:hypothetical protein